ncbi:MAG TPA: AAA family ATPase [Thermomonospora sp.]|nr:AAA family ATPase [Thermomonospora sp.]
MGRARPLRGRAEELGLVLGVLRRTARGGGAGAVVVHGEPGIGKTALLAAAAEQAHRMGYAVGSGAAEESTRLVPMATLFWALRSGSAPLLSGETFAGLAPLYDRQPWLVDRLADVLAELAARAPLLIVLDDLQWADEPTLVALRILPGRLAGSPVVWLLASRPVPGGPLARVPEAIARDVPLTTVTLDALDDDAIRRMAVDRFGREPGPRVRAWLDQAGGHPFLAAALLDGLPDCAPDGCAVPGGLPARLLEGVHNTLAGLPADAARLVEVGAVLGRQFTADNAAALLGGTADALVLPWLDPLERGGVLGDDGERLSFRHDLLRLAVYEDLPPSARRRLHQAAALHLMPRDPVEAAPHLLAGTEDVAALRKAAAAVAFEQPSMAVELAAKAFGLVEPEDPRWTAVGAEVVALLARARRAEEAAALADRLLAHDPPPESVAEIETALTGALWSAGRLDRLREGVGRALALDGVSERSRLRLEAVRVLADSRDPLSGQAVLDRARRLGDTEAEATALWALGEIERDDGHLVEALRHFRARRTLTGAPFSLEEILTLHHLDDFDASAEHITRARRRLRDRPDDGQAMALGVAEMWQCLALARLDAAEAHAQAVLEMGERLPQYAWMTEARVVLSRIAELRGQGDAADREADLAEAVLSSADREVWSALLSLRARLADGDALDALEPARAFVTASLARRHRVRWDLDWMADAARIAVRAGDTCLSHDVATLACTFAERHPQVASAVGRALHVQGLIDGDLGLLEQAVDVLAATPRPLLLAEAHADHGAALLAAGDRETGAAALDRSAELFREAGATGALRGLQRTLRAAGVRRRWVTSPSRPTAGWEALTESERRVARLIAEGHTNKSAAAELFVSPNTVATHLRAVFTKLNVHSRLQLVKAIPQSR